MPNMTLGIFANRASAENALNDLEAMGYSAKDVSILVKDQAVAKDIGESRGTKVAEGAVSGATTGGVIGGIAGLLIGVGAIVVPGIGGLLIGGPLAVALGLTGATATTVSGAVTGGLAGGLIGALMGLGVPKETAEVYERQIREGAILLAVPNNQGDPREIREALTTNGATQVNSV